MNRFSLRAFIVFVALLAAMTSHAQWGTTYSVVPVTKDTDRCPATVDMTWEAALENGPDNQLSEPNRDFSDTRYTLPGKRAKDGTDLRPVDVPENALRLTKHYSFPPEIKNGSPVPDRDGYAIIGKVAGNADKLNISGKDNMALGYGGRYSIDGGPWSEFTKFDPITHSLFRIPRAVMGGGEHFIHLQIGVSAGKSAWKVLGFITLGKSPNKDKVAAGLHVQLGVPESFVRNTPAATSAWALRMNPFLTTGDSDNRVGGINPYASITDVDVERRRQELLHDQAVKAVDAEFAPKPTTPPGGAGGKRGGNGEAPAKNPYGNGQGIERLTPEEEEAIRRDQQGDKNPTFKRPLTPEEASFPWDDPFRKDGSFVITPKVKVTIYVASPEKECTQVYGFGGKQFSYSSASIVAVDEDYVLRKPSVGTVVWVIYDLPDGRRARKIYTWEKKK